MQKPNLRKGKTLFLAFLMAFTALSPMSVSVYAESSDEDTEIVEEQQEEIEEEAIELEETVEADLLNEAAPELTPTEAFVTRLYQECLDREPDAGGLAGWSSKLDNGTKSAAEVVYGFFMSTEFSNKNVSDADFVEKCYKTMMNRASDAGGKAGWVKKLENGLSRTYVLRGFVASTEFYNICKQYGVTQGTITLSQWRDKNPEITAFVARLYTKALNRKFDVNGLNSWTSKILSVSVYDTYGEVINTAKGFLNSTEFANRKTSNTEYAKVLYRTILNREPSTSEATSWASKLNKGTATRSSMLEAFVFSAEFKNYMKGLGYEYYAPAVIEPGYKYIDQNSARKMAVYQESVSGRTVWAVHVIMNDFTQFGTLIARNTVGSRVAANTGYTLVINCDAATLEGRMTVRSGVPSNPNAKNYSPASYSNRTGKLYWTHDSFKTQAGKSKVSPLQGKRVSKAIAEDGLSDTFHFGPALVVDGEINANLSSTGGRRARTFIGTTGRPGELWLFVTHSDGSYGLSGYECAQMLIDKNCSFGVPLDGGGSSELIWKGTKLTSLSERANICDYTYVK